MKKIIFFLKKINPYRETQLDNDGIILDKPWVLWYREGATSLIDVVLNGAMLNFIFGVWGLQPLHYYFALADGLALWCATRIISNLWENYIYGKVKIERAR